MPKSRFELFLDNTCGYECYFENCAYGWDNHCECGCDREFREAKEICEQIDAYEAFYYKLYHSLSRDEYEALPSDDDDADCEALEIRLEELEDFIIRRSQNVDDDRPCSYHSYDCAGLCGEWPRLAY